MNENEKKAIKILGTFEFRQNTINYNKIDVEDVECTKIVLNLVTKLEKENTELKAITKTYDSLKNKQENIVIADKKFFDNGYFNENLIPISFINEMQEKLKKKLNCDNNIRIYTLRDSYLLQISVLDELIDSYLDNKFKNKRQ